MIAEAGRTPGLQLPLDRESEFMLLEPGERSGPVDGRLAAIDRGADPSYVVVAAGEGGMDGYADVTVQPYRRAAGCGYLVMGVRAAAAGRGLGGALLATVRADAERRGLHRLELTVMTHNRRALALYLRHGFEVEGLRRDALTIGGRRISEYYCGLLL